MGQRTYEMLGEYAGSPESNDPLARCMDELPKTVLSHETSMPLSWTAGSRGGRRAGRRHGPAQDRGWADAAESGAPRWAAIWRPLSC
jgi:hypothetical protein